MADVLTTWLNEQIKLNGWSMRELARRAKIDPSTVSKILSGEENPGPKFYQGIARAFSLPLESIERLDREGINPLTAISDSFTDDLIAISQNLPEQAKKELLLFAHYLSWRISHNLPL